MTNRLQRRLRLLTELYEADLALDAARLKLAQLRASLDHPRPLHPQTPALLDCEFASNRRRAALSRLQTTSGHLYHARVAHYLSECRSHRYRLDLQRKDPAAFVAAHGYSYRPQDALRESQQSLLQTRRDRS